MIANEKSEEYIKGYEQGVSDFAEKIKKYYKCLKGNTNSALVSFHIDQIASEMLEKCI